MLALVFPFESELEAFLAGLTGGAPRPLEAPDVSRTRIDGCRAYALESRPEWRFILSGQGKVETALACQAASTVLAAEAWLLVGTACALAPGLKAGELVLTDPCIEYDFQPGPPPPDAVLAGPPRHPTFRSKAPFPHPHAFKSGPVLSADRNVFAPEEKSALHRDYKALASAWEGAGFHRFLERNQAIGWEIRLISETCQEARPSMECLCERMVQGFPALYPILESLDGKIAAQ